MFESIGELRRASAATAPLDEQVARLVDVTLDLINTMAFAAIGRGHDHRFWEVTGLRLGAIDVRIVEHLSAHGPSTVSDMARFQMTTIGQMSRQVRSLTDRGITVRQTSPHDRRQTIVELTPIGRSYGDRWVGTWTTTYAALVARWKPSDARLLHHWLRSVTEVLDEAFPGRSTKPHAAQWQRVIVAEGRATSPPRVAELQALLVELAAWIRQTRGLGLLLRALDSEINESDLPLLHYLTLGRQPSSVTAASQHLGVAHSATGKHLAKLAGRGLVEPVEAPSDRRTRSYTTTPGARAAVKEVLDLQRESFLLVAPTIDSARAARIAPLIDSYLETLKGPSPRL